MAKKASVTPALLALPDELIRVKIVTETPPVDALAERRRAFVRLALFVGVTLLSAIGGLYLIPVTFTQTQSDVHLALTYPPRLALGDEGVIDLTVTNLSAQPITGTLVLSFGDEPALHFVEDSSNALALSDLASGARRTAHVRFQLAALPPWELKADRIDFTPRLNLEAQPFVSYTPQSMEISKVPAVRALLTVVFGVDVFLLGLFRDQLKKLLFPE